jgi:poly(A) RNA polymerase
MANASARDDLAQLFNDDLLGMDAGVGDAAAEEKAREALSHSMFADERRGDGGGTPGRNDGGRDARIRGSPIGVLGGGNPRGSDRRGHDDRGGTRVGGRVVPGPRAPGREDAPPGGRHREDRHGRHGVTPHGNDRRERDGARRGRHGGEHDTLPDHGDVSRFDDARDELDDDFDSEEESERREWPSPAELLADARSILDAADGALMRDGRAPSAENMARLDGELRRIVRQQRTTPHDDQKRQNLLARFSHMLDKKFPGVSCAPFGSYVSVFHTAGSDIDLSLEVDPNSPWYDAKEMGTAGGLAGAGGRGSRGGNRRHQPPRGFKSKKVQLLSKVAGELRYRGFAEVNLIAHARVPLIKLYDPETGVNCDVCVGNDGVYKSAVLGVFADLDERYRDLVFLVKMWAKRFDCNDATAGSFNSFALSLMCLFHLQTRSPPILPPVLRLTLPSDAAADADLAAERERANNLEPVRKTPVSKIRQQSDAMRDVGVVEARAASRWRGCGADNTATLAELLVTFFTHFRSVEPLWKHGLVASTYAGRWVAGGAWPPGRYCVGVEDPFAAGDNVARAVQRRSLPKVLSAVRDGTLAMARVCWADSDEDLQRALHDLLGAGALPPREMPQSGWPTLGGAGGNEPLNSPGGAGMSPGRPFGMDAFGGGAGGAPPAAPPLPPPAPNRLDAGLLNLLTGGVGAPPGMMGMGMGPGPPPGPGGGRGGATPGAGLFGAAAGWHDGSRGHARGDHHAPAPGARRDRADTSPAAAPRVRRPGPRPRRRRRRRLRRAVPRGGRRRRPAGVLRGQRRVRR